MRSNILRRISLDSTSFLTQQLDSADGIDDQKEGTCGQHAPPFGNTVPILYLGWAMALPLKQLKIIQFDSNPFNNDKVWWSRFELCDEKYSNPKSTINWRLAAHRQDRKQANNLCQQQRKFKLETGIENWKGKLKPTPPTVRTTLRVHRLNILPDLPVRTWKGEL